MATETETGVPVLVDPEEEQLEDIVSDLESFHKIWSEIRQRMETSRAPAIVYREQSLVSKLLRDLLPILG